MIGELFKMITGVNLTHVPYRSAGPAITDLLGGQVQVSFSTITGAMEFIRAGSLRALAVTASVVFQKVVAGAPLRDPLVLVGSISALMVYVAAVFLLSKI